MKQLVKTWTLYLCVCTCASELTSELTSSRVLIGDVIFNIQERGTQGVQPASVVHFCQALCCRPHYGLPAAVVCVKEIEQR